MATWLRARNVNNFKFKDDRLSKKSKNALSTVFKPILGKHINISPSRVHLNLRLVLLIEFSQHIMWLNKCIPSVNRNHVLNCPLTQPEIYQLFFFTNFVSIFLHPNNYYTSFQKLEILKLER